MSDSDDFQFDPRHGGGAAAGGGGRVQAAPQLPAQQIPQWRINPPPGLREYLERQRQGIPGVFERAQEAQQDGAPAIPVMNAMEEALGDMERVLEYETSWKSDILPRGRII